MEVKVSNDTLLDIPSIKLIKPDIYVQSENTNEPPQNKIKKYEILGDLGIDLLYFSQNCEKQDLDISTTSLTKSLIMTHK